MTCGASKSTRLSAYDHPHDTANKCRSLVQKPLISKSLNIGTPIVVTDYSGSRVINQLHYAMPQERNRAMMGFLSTNILQVAALAAEAAATRTRRPRRLPKKPTQKQNNFFNQVLNHRTWTWTSRDSETSPFLCLHAFLPISQPKLRRRRARPRPRSDPRKPSGLLLRLLAAHSDFGALTVCNSHSSPTSAVSGATRTCPGPSKDHLSSDSFRAFHQARTLRKGPPLVAWMLGISPPRTEEWSRRSNKADTLHAARLHRAVSFSRKDCHVATTVSNEH